MDLLSTFVTGTVGDAARGGAGADRLAIAFIAGYQAALRALVPGLRAVGSFLVTEEGGGHPAAIRTQLSGGRLAGRKRFATQGIEAETLIVVASAGAEGGHTRLSAVMIPADRPGVTRTPLPPTPFCPEIGLAEVHLDVEVRPDEILPGDGYDEYLKPFRTIEDIHVLAATLGFVLHTATRFAWPREAIERLLAQLAPASALAAAPREPSVHLALSGWLAGTERLLADLAPHWAQVDPDWRARWERDQPLLSLAHKVRVQRTGAAWKSLA